jgi:glucose dehydrogenase
MRFSGVNRGKINSQRYRHTTLRHTQSSAASRRKTVYNFCVPKKVVNQPMLLRSSALLLTTLSIAHAQTDWPVYGHDPGGTRFSPLKQITPKNVSSLKLAWSYDTQAPMNQAAPPAGGPGAAAGRGRGPSRGNRSRRSESTPLVINGVMYLSTAYNRVLALEPETGKKLWEYEGPHTPALRGIAYWPGDTGTPPRILYGTNDGWLVALNAKTGQLTPGFGNEGMVNLREGFAEKFQRGQYSMSSAPTVYKDLVITGSQVQESPSLGLPGDIRAWDVHNGKLKWTFHTIPRPGEPNHETWKEDQWQDRSGANAWGSITVDVERGLLFAGVGSVTRDFDGGDRKGPDLYGDCIVALEADTGKLRWFFQTTHHDNWDYDPTAPPALINVVHQGKKIPALAQSTKQGLLFLLDRTNGKPIYGVEERLVISDNTVPGDEPWPTQPFPVKPPPLTRTSFDPKEVATVTPEHEKFCRALLETEGGALGGTPYAQYGPKLRVVFPSWIGGGNWGGASYDPHLGYVFVNMQDLGNLNKMIKSQNGDFYVRVAPDDKNLEADSSLSLNTKNSWPCQQPPWGALVAVNVNTGNIAWSVPLGWYDELEAKGIPKTGTPNVGGSIATAGGLVFIGASSDERFHAFDSHTGKELWTTTLNDVARSVPITYLGKTGKQYVAVMAGGGGGPLASGIPPGTGRLYVFSLP